MVYASGIAVALDAGDVGGEEVDAVAVQVDAAAVVMRGSACRARIWTWRSGSYRRPAAAVLGLFKYFNYRSKRDRLAEVGASFVRTVVRRASAAWTSAACVSAWG